MTTLQITLLIQQNPNNNPDSHFVCSWTEKLVLIAKNIGQSKQFEKHNFGEHIEPCLTAFYNTT